MRTLGNLSHDELAVLVREYLLAGQLMDRAGMPHLISAYGRDEMAAIAIDEWMGASPIYTTRMQRLLGYVGTGVPTIFKGLQLDIGAPPEFMDFRLKVIDDHHGEFWLDHCGALMDVEPMGDDYVHAMCHTIEDPTFDATAVATNRRAQIRPIHRPPRAPADRHPHCHWTVIIDESHPEVALPEPMTHIERTLLASLELAPLELAPLDAGARAGAGVAADTADGWNAYDGPVDPDLQTEQFSTAALRAIADEVCVQQHLLVMSFCFAIERRHGTEDAVRIIDQQFVGIAGLTSDRLRRALGLGTDPGADPGSGPGSGPVRASLDEIATVLELHPAFRPREYVDFHVELSGESTGDSTGESTGHGHEQTLTLRLGDCAALHEPGFDNWISRLVDGPADGLAAAVWGITPFARVERTGATTWTVRLDDVALSEPPEVALTRFSSGAAFEFTATPVTLAARRGSAHLGS